MRGARAPVTYLFEGFVLAGCVQTTSPVAFSPRAKRDAVTLTHNSSRTIVPLGTAISPGDTVLVSERWF